MQNYMDKLKQLNVSERFWVATSDASWDRDNDIECCRERLDASLVTNDLDIAQYRDLFDSLKELINDETLFRINNGKEVFEGHIDDGGDDYHFMDLPAHLISNGREAVENYLGGGLIGFTPIECFAYVLHDD